MLGYAGKFLEVDLSKSSFKNTTLPDDPGEPDNVPHYRLLHPGGD